MEPGCSSLEPCGGKGPAPLGSLSSPICPCPWLLGSQDGRAMGHRQERGGPGVLGAAASVQALPMQG